MLIIRRGKQLIYEQSLGQTSLDLRWRYHYRVSHLETARTKSPTGADVEFHKSPVPGTVVHIGRFI